MGSKMQNKISKKTCLIRTCMFVTVSIITSRTSLLLSQSINWYSDVYCET